MKISRIDCFPLKITTPQAYLGGEVKASDSDYYYRPEYRCVYSRKMETCLVKITTDSGHVGWGEALAPVVPQVIAELITQLFAPLLTGQSPFASQVLNARMYDAMRDRGHITGYHIDALAAVDIALWDLKGQILNQPVYQLLGGAFREQIPCYVSGLPEPDLPARCALALRWQQKGFNAIKLALGYGVQQDIENVRAIRDALGPQASLFLDAHWNYSVAQAAELANALHPLGVGFLEAPLLPEDIAGHRELRAKSPLPIALGETERTRYQFKPFIEQRAMDIVQPDVGRTGITELMHIASLAQTWNLQVAPHLSVGLGPCIAASIHVAAALPNLFMLEYQPPVFELANQLLDTPLVCEAGHYTLPQGAGLGIAINEARVRESVMGVTC
ncbi:mandelate racemase/muconate lactonizing enzyme family protein [Kosakonia cowanii]|jgi:galactonate dehydratase|uniref:mandelate racemase/muconate lactonizing enzyme family protein n=1 Tax=Kosakonia cowanii TaxID=208223 RepID=UPI0011209DF5|nr:mandelate racemase/muconate lactonizing enzyme family protein [Kosakonia cowanii]MDP9766841.1 galactonate dehydratase [Atlantibacter hermannii]MDM9618330.1 mandelate racemase/muconate lactonizing enzyme family protein [Kosakonia cowanii]MDP4563417.1 mandelate racemase/muconate lactonizing enzyme family protein [Kosakonia cowanii]TPD64292.1 mandelate racemase/muconate lactonizing enzyme family protein [Kosakonia cowanii]TPD88624.1 mandelate racemase/muconate lactonizing enzyme family protein